MHIVNNSRLSSKVSNEPYAISRHYADSLQYQGGGPESVQAIGR